MPTGFVLDTSRFSNVLQNLYWRKLTLIQRKGYNDLQSIDSDFGSNLCGEF